MKRELDLANALREERKSAELQHLDKDFYQQVGVYLASLGQELSQVEDPFSVEAQILQDTLKSEKNSVNKLMDQRVKKIVRRALRSAARTVFRHLRQPLGRRDPAVFQGWTKSPVR